MSFDQAFMDEHWPAMRDRILQQVRDNGHVTEMPKVPPQAIGEMYLVARKAYAAEDYLQAEHLFQAMTLFGPADPRGWLGYGGACEAQQKWEQAALGFGMAMALTPGDPVAAFRVGVCLMALDKPEEAAVAFDAAASTIEDMRSQPKKLPYAERAATMLKMIQAKAR